MVYYEEKMRLIIITRSLFLSQLQVGRGGGGGGSETVLIPCQWMGVP